ncbi:MAG: signal peptidase II [Acidimicrobiales bacterium]
MNGAKVMNGAGLPRDRQLWRSVIVSAVAAAVIAVDQVTKSLAQRYLRSGALHLVGPLQLRLSYNTGIAFGIGQGLSPLFVGLGIVVIAVLLAATRSATRPSGAIGTGLMLGGALSNLADRVLRHNGGAVIDFIYVHYWPTFNIADASIVTGAAVLLVFGWRGA